MKKLFFISLLIVGIFTKPTISELQAQITNPCWCPPLTYIRDGQHTNLDSNCVIDTCGIWYPSANCDSAYWNNIQSKFGEEAKKRVYGKKFWEILFTVPAIPIPAVPKPDTIIYVDWTAIDTAYPEIRNTFKNMAENFGDLYFEKLSPTDNEYSKSFRLYFTNYVNIDTVTKIGTNTTGIIVFDFVGWPYISYDNVIENNKNDFFIQIYPNPATDFLELTVSSELTHSKIEIFSIESIKMFESEPARRIDVSRLCTGVYYIKIGSKVYKFVKM